MNINLPEIYKKFLDNAILHDLTEAEKLKRDVEANVISNTFKHHIASKPRKKKR